VSCTGPYTPTINLLSAEDPGNGSAHPEHIYDESLPPELAVLAAAFPFTKDSGILGVKDGIRALAPSYDEAIKMTEAFFSLGSWLGSPYTKERFMLKVLMPLYASKSWELERADVMALFFGILSVGAMFDCNRPQYDPIAFRMHKLCAVSLALSKPLDRPTITALEALVGYYSTIFGILHSHSLAITLVLSSAFRYPVGDCSALGSLRRRI